MSNGTMQMDKDLLFKIIDLVLEIKDEKQQAAVLAGIIAATDQFIDLECAKQIKERIKSSSLTEIYERDKFEAVTLAYMETLWNKIHHEKV